jgi:peptidyl-prolyl cis-trans isomerase B (cyclophilin B)
MNKWAVPLVVIVILIFGVMLFLNQGKSKEAPELPNGSDMFKPISITPGQGQQGAQQQQQGAYQQQQQVQGAQQQQQIPGAPNQQQPQTNEGQQLKASYSAVIKTSKGNITVNLRADAAPNTVVNFINKSQGGFYNNLTWHRVEDWVVQGGDPKGDGSGGGQMLSEINVLPFTAGTLGIARRNDIRVSNDAQFFITKVDASWLDQQYTNFGSVTDGMDVVQKLSVGDKIISITVDL